MRKLARCTGEDWLRDAITLFADDILAQGQFGSLEECQQHLRRMGTLLDLLEEAGMKINLNKTEAMLTVHGRNQNLLQSQCVQRTANGYFLKIPRKQSIWYIDCWTEKIGAQQTGIDVDSDAKNDIGKSLISHWSESHRFLS